jgi:PIN domain nuclease of toxin-antitoxin system
VRLLLDTHALLWFLSGDETLAVPARDRVADPANDVFVSVVSLWEIAVKLRIGKLRADLRAITEASAQAGFDLLGIRPDHLLAIRRLPVFDDHRDPFDHLLIAQAIVENLVFMSEDRNAPRYPVSVIRCRD